MEESQDDFADVFSVLYLTSRSIDDALAESVSGEIFLYIATCELEEEAGDSRSREKSHVCLSADASIWLLLAGKKATQSSASSQQAVCKWGAGKPSRRTRGSCKCPVGPSCPRFLLFLAYVGGGVTSTAYLRRQFLIVALLDRPIKAFSPRSPRNEVGAQPSVARWQHASSTSNPILLPVSACWANERENLSG